MPTALFISPHLDDVAFSCGGTLLRLVDAGWDTTLLTVFTRSVPNPSGFALRCQTDKGLGPEVDYLALRRDEDREFARIASVGEVLHWPYPEAPHRGYESAPELFGTWRSEDDPWQPIAADLSALVHHLQPDVVFAPQGLGNHIDHRQVIKAAMEAGLAPTAVWYRDTPYALREPSAAPSPLLPDGLSEYAVAVDDVLNRKIAGCIAYASQIGFQFGGPEEVRRKLMAFHQAEAKSAEREGHAERLLVPPGMTLLHEFAN